MQVPFYLESIAELGGFSAGFVSRVAGVSVDTDREATCMRLEPAHREAVKDLGFGWDALHRAEQVHGGDLAVIENGDSARVWAGVDGLVTAEPGVLLGIYVADCGAVYMADPVKGVVALLHSGKKGTEANIVERAIVLMQESWGSDPLDLHVALAPCIRPPAYEVNFAARIREQVTGAGVPQAQFVDAQICTSSDLKTYYSYRQEKGATGRMLALLGRRDF